MIQNTLTLLFKRDLNRLKTEIELYSNEADLWLVDKGITNSAGNLCLHLVGNLNAYIGAELGESGYIRKRDLEFSLKDVPRTELFKMIDETIDVVENTLAKLTTEDLAKDYPIMLTKDKMTTEFFLIYLTLHFAYHLGQINFHRRLLD